MGENIVTIKKIMFPTKRRPKFTALVEFESEPKFLPRVVWRKTPVLLSVIEPSSEAGAK